MDPEYDVHTSYVLRGNLMENYADAMGPCPQNVFHERVGGAGRGDVVS